MIPFKKPIIRLIEVGTPFAYVDEDVYTKSSGNDESGFLGADSATVVENKPLDIPTLRVGPSHKSGNTTDQNNEALNPKVVTEVQEFLGESTDIVFVVSAMGDRYGVLVAPLIARKAKAMGVLTISVVLISPAVGNDTNTEVADKDLLELRRCSDSIIVLFPEPRLGTSGHNTREGFRQGRGCIMTLVEMIVNILEVGSEVNVDLEDIRTVLAGAGTALLGTSKSSGPGRADRVIKEAMEFHCSLNKNIFGAKRILLSIISGEEAELEMEELVEITDAIQVKAGEEAEVIFGHGIDPSLGGNIRLTLIATGLPESKQ